MRKPIGERFRSPAAERLAVVFGPAVVGTDLGLVLAGTGDALRLTLALVAFATMVALTGGDLRSLGLIGRPRHGWKVWTARSFGIGLAVAGCLVVGGGIWYLLGNRIAIPETPPQYVRARVVSMCVVDPVMEEAIYRVVLCVSLAKQMGNGLTIAISGLLFAALHFAYGNPSPENLVGGLFLAWAYLKSESVLMPVLLHSIGNGIVLIGQVAAWLVLSGGG